MLSINGSIIKEVYSKNKLAVRISYIHYYSVGRLKTIKILITPFCKII